MSSTKLGFLTTMKKRKKKQQNSEFLETGVPVFNITGQIKKNRTRKINQLPTPPANATPNDNISFLVFRLFRVKWP